MCNLYQNSTSNENPSNSSRLKFPGAEGLRCEGMQCLVAEGASNWSRNGVPFSMLIATRCFQSNGEAILLTVRKIQEFLSKWGDSMDTRWALTIAINGVITPTSGVTHGFSWGYNPYKVDL